MEIWCIVIQLFIFIVKLILQPLVSILESSHGQMKNTMIQPQFPEVYHRLPRLFLLLYTNAPSSKGNWDQLYYESMSLKNLAK